MEGARILARWQQMDRSVCPPTPGEYTYKLESTDRNNPDLNGHESRVEIAAYEGTDPLLKHGMLRVSSNKRYFEHADGTPFYWLGDTWWTGLSDRLSWDAFQELTANRKAKGFTVVQIVAGLVPSNEEQAPIDPGFHNEGGAVWDPEFKQINPKYFDYADRRIQLLVNAGIAPAIVGAWHQALDQMGVAKMEKHWRYIIARYGAYPVFWVVGGEVYDPPEEIGRSHPGFEVNGKLVFDLRSPGWSEVARYIRATDPYHHPITVHEIPPPFDIPLKDESLTDFDLFQPSHMGWPSIALEVALLNTCRSRTSVTKPEVVGEIGYEGIGGTNLEDFQRSAFWLAMLNGAAGFTYGANPVFEAYTSDKPFQRTKYTLLTWKEGMNLPGGTEISLGAKLLQQFPWWQFEAHPDWVAPRGTTLLEPRTERNGSELGTWLTGSTEFPQPSGSTWTYPGGEWAAKQGNMFLPYAAGVAGKVRVIYDPCFSLFCGTPPTVLGLEEGVRYRAYYWEPTLGVKFDLGVIERPHPGDVLMSDKFENGDRSEWTDYGDKSSREAGHLSANKALLSMVKGVTEQNLVASVTAHSDADAEIVLRFHDPDNYLAAVYSPKTQTVYLIDREKGTDGPPLGSMQVAKLGSEFRLSAEVRGKWAVVSADDGHETYTSQIVPVTDATAGGVGLKSEGGSQEFANFEVRKSAELVKDEQLERKLYDAHGVYRGELKGAGWDDFGKEKVILLDAYRPNQLPMPQDWILVLENRN